MTALILVMIPKIALDIYFTYMTWKYWKNKRVEDAEA